MADPVEGISSLHDTTAMGIDFLAIGIVPDGTRSDP
jgi:hypothetical protein